MKKGFTFVELLAVVTIIGMLALIVLPKIVERFEKKREEASNMALEVIYLATNEYLLSNSKVIDEVKGYSCISLKTLVESGNLIEPIIDPKTGSKIKTTNTVEVTRSNNQYKFLYNTDRCN
ncbi:MAG: type II secretion system protein [Bacilli bacterium]